MDSFNKKMRLYQKLEEQQAGPLDLVSCSSCKKIMSFPMLLENCDHLHCSLCLRKSSQNASAQKDVTRCLVCNAEYAKTKHLPFLGSYAKKIKEVMQEVEKEFSMPQMMDPSFDLGKLTEDPFAELENIGDVNFDISQFLAGPVVPVADGTVSITNEFLDSNQILEFQTDETFESNFQQIIENIVNVPLPTEEVTSDKKRKRTEGKNVSNFGKQFTIKRLNTTRV